MSEERSAIRTFLIADIRGYSRFTQEYGDEAAARLAAKFEDIVREIVDTRTGQVVEIRGGEALAVFDSARQAIRAAMDMQPGTHLHACVSGREKTSRCNY